MSSTDVDSFEKRYRIPMDEEVSKGRINVIKDQLDALIYFYPEGFFLRIIQNNIIFINSIMNIYFLNRI